MKSLRTLVQRTLETLDKRDPAAAEARKRAREQGADRERLRAATVKR